MSEHTKANLRQKLGSAREELFELINRMDDGQWNTVIYTEGETWQASHLLRHIVASEQGMTATIENILKGGPGVPEDFDLARWNARTVTKMAELTTADLQDKLVSNRRRLFAIIDDLSPEDLSKRGRHASLRVMTIKELLELIADHEKHHTMDIRSAVILDG